MPASLRLSVETLPWIIALIVAYSLRVLPPRSLASFFTTAVILPAWVLAIVSYSHTNTDVPELTCDGLIKPIEALKAVLEAKRRLSRRRGEARRLRLKERLKRSMKKQLQNLQRAESWNYKT